MLLWGNSRGPNPREIPRSSPASLKKPCPSQLFYSDLHYIFICFRISPTKMHRRSVLTFQKSIDGSVLALPKCIDGSVLPSSGFPQSSPTRIPQTGNSVDHCYYERKATTKPIWNRIPYHADTVFGHDKGYLVKYTPLRRKELLKAKGYIWPYIPSWVLIRTVYHFNIH